MFEARPCTMKLVVRSLNEAHKKNEYKADRVCPLV
jgi:hypothetical protein